MRFPGCTHTDVACTDCGMVSERVAGKGHVDGNSLQQIFFTVMGAIESIERDARNDRQIGNDGVGETKESATGKVI